MNNESAIISMVKTATEISVNKNELLEHEIVHILGQMLGISDVEITDEAIVQSVFNRTDYKLVEESLQKILINSERSSTTRHEAGESLGAILSIGSLDLLDKYSDKNFEKSQEVRETCQIAASKIRWFLKIPDIQLETNRNPFLTVDPAPAMDFDKIENICLLLNDSTQDMFTRYQCLFTLRNQLVNELIKNIIISKSDENLYSKI